MDESAQNLVEAIDDLTKQLEEIAGDTGVVAVLVDSIAKAVARVSNCDVSSFVVVFPNAGLLRLVFLCTEL